MVVGACLSFAVLQSLQTPFACSAAKPANELALASDALRTQSAVHEAELEGGLQSAERSIKDNIT